MHEQELEKALKECQQRLQAAEKDLLGAQERKAQLQASAGAGTWRIKSRV